MRAQIVLVPTGLQIAVPDGFEAQVRPRSGLAVKHGISLPNTPATIDSDYRGEIRVPLINLGRLPFRRLPRHAHRAARRRAGGARHVGRSRRAAADRSRRAGVRTLRA